MQNLKDKRNAIDVTFKKVNQVLGSPIKVELVQIHQEENSVEKT